VVERIGVFQQIGEEVADGGRDDETDVLYIDAASLVSSRGRVGVEACSRA
jgi:hypothetical protein